jgi:tagatose 6-phosphate kinase
MILTVTLNPAIDKLYMVESLRPYEVMRVKKVVNTAGGKGLNVSRVASLLGEQVTAMGFVGGYTGMLLESLLGDAKITRAFTRVGGETRSCINIWDCEAGRSTEFLEPGSPVTEEDIEKFLNEYKARLPGASVVTISGSVPKGVPDDFYVTLVKLAKAAGKPVVADTSSQTLKKVLPACPTAVKPNTDEISELMGVQISGPEAAADAAGKLHLGGIELAAVSLGAQGVVASCREGTFRAVPPKVATVNTVGSGDSMVAGLAAGISRRLPAAGLLRLAVAAGTANTLTQQTGTINPGDLERILPQVKVERLGD